MTYSIYINQKKAMEWDLSLKAAVLLSQMSILHSWAKPVVYDDETYFMLFRAKIAKELPILGKSKATISSYIRELEDKELIESIDKNSTPAYRLTSKGNEWTSDSTNTDEGENQKEEEIAPEKEKKRKRPYFSLSKPTIYEDLSEEYKKNLVEACKIRAEKEGLDLSEVGEFVNWHASKGTLFKDWSRGFVTWCKKHEDFKNRAYPQINNTKSINKNNLGLM